MHAHQKKPVVMAFMPNNAETGALHATFASRPSMTASSTARASCTMMLTAAPSMNSWRRPSLLVSMSATQMTAPAIQTATHQHVTAHDTQDSLPLVLSPAWQMHACNRGLTHPPAQAHIAACHGSHPPCRVATALPAERVPPWSTATLRTEVCKHGEAMPLSRGSSACMAAAAALTREPDETGDEADDGQRWQLSKAKHLTQLVLQQAALHQWPRLR